jgi:hypothetical protein
MTFWLKMIGTSERHWPVGRPYDRRHIGFRGRRPSGVHPGDRMILYAVGSRRLFAVVDVVSDWRNNDEDGWPYRIDIRWPPTVNLAPSDGVDANEVSADLTERVRRRSHIRLTQQEFQLAATRLRESGASL